jgi:hypothetical protein
MKKKKKSFDSRKWYRYHFFGIAMLSVPKEESAVDTTIANISFSGMGLYSSTPVGKGKKVTIRIYFVDKAGKIQEDTIKGRVDWQKKLKNIYLIGVVFDEEPSVVSHPILLEQLTWLIETYHWPQPYKDKRIAML